MKKIFIIIVSVVVALMMLVTSFIMSGCSSAPKHRIAMDNELRSKLIVRGQSFKKPTKYEKTTFTWPLKGPVMSLFGIRHGRRHDGIDISAPRGTPIYSAADGEVVFSGTMHGYGNLILVRHGGDYYTAYSHNSANLVDEGKKVRQGDTIAEVGRTGRATGNHLHFEIRRGQEAVDPLAFLPAVEGVYVKKSAVDKDRYVSRSLKKGSKYAKKDVAAKGKKDLSDKKRGPSKDKLAKKGAASSKDALTAGENGTTKADGSVALKKGPVKAGALANGKTITKKSKAATSAAAAAEGTKLASRMGVMPKDAVAPASAKSTTESTAKSTAKSTTESTAKSPAKSAAAPASLEGDLVAPSDTVADALGAAKPESASATKSSSTKTPVKVAAKESAKGTAKNTAKSTAKNTTKVAAKTATTTAKKSTATTASVKSKTTLASTTTGAATAVPSTSAAAAATPKKATTTVAAKEKTSTKAAPATKKADATVATKKKTPAKEKVASTATPKKTTSSTKPIVMKETGVVKKALPQ